MKRFARVIMGTIAMLALMTATSARAGEWITLFEKKGVIQVTGGYWPNKVPNYLIIIWKPGYRDMDSMAWQVSRILLGKYTNDIMPPEWATQAVGAKLIHDKLLGEWRKYSSGKYSQTTWISVQNQMNRQWRISCGYN